MIHWCFHCELDTAGQHENNCPFHPDNRTFTLSKSEQQINSLTIPIMKFHSPEPDENESKPPETK